MYLYEHKIICSSFYFLCYVEPFSKHFVEYFALYCTKLFLSNLLFSKLLNHKSSLDFAKLHCERSLKNKVSNAERSVSKLYM